MGGFSFCTLKRLFGSGMRFFEEKNIKMKFRQSFVIKKKNFFNQKMVTLQQKEIQMKKKTKKRLFCRMNDAEKSSDANGVAIT